jgi:hypothetical protein
MTRHGDAEDHGEVQRLLVRHSELFGELVQPDVLRHVLGSAFRPCGATDLVGSMQLFHVATPVPVHRSGELVPERIDHLGGHRSLPRTFEGAA